MVSFIKKKHILGIITCKNPRRHPPFSEAGFFAQLTIIGRLYKVHVIIINPLQINWAKKTTLAWHYNKDKIWSSNIEPLPNLFYDRCHYANKKHLIVYRENIQKLRQDPTISFLGKPLAGKLQTYDLLKTNPKIAPFLPKTKLCHDPQTVFDFIKQAGPSIIKPNMGSHGKGVVAIEEISSDLFRIKGRTMQNSLLNAQVKSKQNIRAWLYERLKTRKHIVQPFLDLCTENGYPFDLRLLMQKNEKNEFNITGKAIRIGQHQTITANLHGGGRAESLDVFFKKYYINDQSKIKTQIKTLGENVAKDLEMNHGSLVELGLDIGIEPTGRIWLLEVNSKPGRAIFMHTGEPQIRKRSIQLPIRYAASLLSKMHGRV